MASGTCPPGTCLPGTGASCFMDSWRMANTESAASQVVRLTGEDGPAVDVRRAEKLPSSCPTKGH